MLRTLRFRTSDDERILVESDTLAYRLHAGYELHATKLGVAAGTKVRIELLDDSDHLLDSRTYVVPEPDLQSSPQNPHPSLEPNGHIRGLGPTKTRIATAR
jgi:hypothetical protein